MLFLIISNTLGVGMLVCPAIFSDTVINGDLSDKNVLEKAQPPRSKIN